jgi:hypothetical protein
MRCQCDSDASQQRLQELDDLRMQPTSLLAPAQSSMPAVHQATHLCVSSRWSTYTRVQLALSL